MKKETTHTSKAKPLTVVGIGASAGGLTALKTFLAQIPEKSGLAFVIVMHLLPDQKSQLADILQKQAKIPVKQVTKTVALRANHVYVIPPGYNLDSIDTHLHLSKLEEERNSRAPIDHFFRTLADTHDGQAIGVILSGTGSDGTLGIKEINGKGGLVFVQDPNEAEYDGMPRSAIASGIVDLVLPLAKIPEQILRFTQTEPLINMPKEGEDIHEEDQHLIQNIFAYLLTHFGRDFSHYKSSTIMRRLHRRMQLSHIKQLEEYLKLLHEKPEEAQALSDDLLVNVTSFFRNPEVFDWLAQKVLPQLFKGKGPKDNIRVWSVGCATGEEAYSLAILLLEEAARHKTSPALRIFASDMHQQSLQKAREGLYPADITLDVNDKRLRKFFVKEGSAYRIRKNVRELIIFAPHNLLSDPSYSKLDLIVCRNLLIYLQRDIQQDIFKLFHYALKPDGFLLLGTSESIDSSELFLTEHKEYRIFRKHHAPVPELRLPVFQFTRHQMPVEPKEEAHPIENLSYGAIHQWMVENYAPPSLLLNNNNQIVHLSEHAGRYLLHPGGEPTTNAFKVVREEFRVELQSALFTAKKKGKITHSRPISILLKGKPQQIILSVYPSNGQKQKEYFLVIFNDWQPAKLLEKVDNISGTKVNTKLSELEEELALTKIRFQSIMDEYEKSQEKMSVSNEELQSMNEELRSMMEELETSKEELQSVNEELTTINQENQLKVKELGLLSDDLQNLLKSTDIATLFLDRELHISRFTPRVGELFNVRSMDQGRSLSDFTHRLGYDELQTDAQQVLEKLVPVEREVQDQQGRWYLTRLLPYQSREDRIEGVVITFVDITEKKKVEREVMKALIEGQEVERDRVAKELHEGLSQSFTALQLNLNALAMHNGDADPKAKHLFEKLKEILSNTIRDIKAISKNLMPDVLKAYGLVNGLEYLCQTFSDTNLVKVNFQGHHMDKPLDMAQSVGLYRIAQESINNSLIHGKATEINLQLIGHKNSVILEVEDNGIGFDVTAPNIKEKGLGLRNMETRAESLKGTFLIDSHPDKGTSITVEIPLQND